MYRTASHKKEFFMKNAYKLLGIIAVAAVIVFLFAACDNSTSSGGGGGGGGGGNEKMLKFEAFFPSSTIIKRLGVFPVGTTLAQAKSQTNIVAGCETPGGESSGGSINIIYTAKLYDPITKNPWTGSGTYDVYFEMMDGTYYKASSVNITSATTTISSSSVNPVS
jgi:hypothetical protein